MSGGAYYWLRSPYDYSSYAKYVHYDGDIDYNHVFSAHMGVRPALSLQIS